MVQPTGQQRWTRSRYPLHSNLLTDAWSNRVNKPSPTVSTASELPRPNSEEHRSSLQHLKEAPKDQPNHTRDDDSTRSGSTSRSASPSSTMSTSSIKYHLATTMDLADASQGQTHPSADEPGRRTLRRTPRSRRIEARISLADLEAAAVQTQPKEDTSDTADVKTNTANEQSNTAVADGATVNGRKEEPKTRRASLPQSDSESDRSNTTPSSQGNKRKASAEKSKGWQQSTYPLQAPLSHTDFSRPPTPPTPTPDRKHPETSHDQLSRSAPATETTSGSRHQAYPLQSTLPISSNQHSSPTPAPAPAPGANAVPAAQPAKAMPSTPQKNALGRKGYPLQSPASMSDLRYSSQSSSTPQTSEPSKTYTASTAQSEEKAASAATSQKGRQTYPLQSPARITDPRGSKSDSKDGGQGTTAQSPASDRAAPKSKTMRRTGYPLQSPASMTNLRQSTASPSPASQEPAAERNDNDRASVSGSAFRRQGYPAQSPATGSNQQQPSSAPKPGNQALAVQTQEESQTTTNPNRFRRQKYPLQSSANGASTPRTPRPPPSYPSATAASESRTDEESSSNNSPPPVYSPSKQVETRGEAREETVLIPKNIRGCKDADKPLKGRTIVVCLDGTGDKFDDDNSNIVHIVSALKKDDSQQVTYYQAGIGTYNDGGLSTGFAAAADMAVGSGLGLHIRDAYHFLMHSYKEGDRICIFGFSRGAYTARCLAGMIHKVGLLPPRNIQQIQFAYEFYKKDTAEGWQQSEDFKRAFSIDINVYFLGCFDSVDSVGFIPRQLPLSSTPANKPHYFRHAIALDERRAKFKICRYQSAKKQGQLEKVKSFNEEDDAALSKALDQVSASKTQDDKPPQYSSDVPFGREHHPNVTDAEYQSLTSHDDDFDTDVSEVWFTGCHADVGGGAVANVERHKLAQIPLRWMIRQAFECNTGIIFKTRFLAEYGLDVHTLWPKYSRLEVPKILHTPPHNYVNKYEKALPPRSIRRGKLVPIRKRGQDHTDHHGEPFFHLSSHTDEDWTPEQVEDYYDAMSPMNDQLVQAPSWWILEAMPVQYKISTKPGEVRVVTGPNMGLARLVEERDAQVHWTVVQRAHQMGYKPAARPAMHTEWRIVA